MNFELDFVTIQTNLQTELKRISEGFAFGGLVDHVANPHSYAQEPYTEYLKKYLDGPKSVLFLGMNPGPNGMAKRGIPFGNGESVVDWLDICGDETQQVIINVSDEHVFDPGDHLYGRLYEKNTYQDIRDDEVNHRFLPNVPIRNLDPAPEESGRRLWSLLRDLNKTPEQFFKNCFVHNYCPLLFLSIDGFDETTQKFIKQNITPEAIRKVNKELILPLEKVCDKYLEQTIRHLDCRVIVAVGSYAEARAKQVVEHMQSVEDPTSHHILVVGIPHPSPATRMSERIWRARVKEEFEKYPGLLPLVARHNKPQN